MPVQMGFYQCTRELSPFTFGDSSEYPAFSESLGFTKTWRDTNGRNRLILTWHSMLQIDDWFCECIIWAQVKKWFALSTDQVRGNNARQACYTWKYSEGALRVPGTGPKLPPPAELQQLSQRGWRYWVWMNHFPFFHCMVLSKAVTSKPDERANWKEPVDAV